jgi:hypothetical protein
MEASRYEQDIVFGKTFRMGYDFYDVGMGTSGDDDDPFTRMDH